MKFTEKYDKQFTGLISGLLLPFIVAFIVFLFTKQDPGLAAWFNKITDSGIETHIISLCVFPNVAIFLFFNYFDMLRASRGVLAITIVWAAIVFIIKFLT